MSAVKRLFVLHVAKVKTRAVCSSSARSLGASSVPISSGLMRCLTGPPDGAEREEMRAPEVEAVVLETLVGAT